MNRFLTLLAACLWTATSFAAPLFFQSVPAHRAPGVQPALQPAQYRTVEVAEAALKSFLSAAPHAPEQALEIELPTPDGGTRAFRVWQNEVMHPDLAAKYPDIKTFTATALDNPAVVAKLDYSPRGFRAIVMDGSSTFFIDPYGPGGEGYAIAYYKRDYSRPMGQRMGCEVMDEDEVLEAAQRGGNGLTSAMKLYGTTRKTYRLAVACTGEYSVAVAGPSPTKPAVLAAIVTSVNRVSGVYEKEFAVTLQLIANNDTLINLDGTTDPYNNNNGASMLSVNQTTVDARVGSANYDVGHVFSTGGGGVASAGVCASNKARGVTGGSSPVGDPFDIDYVAHEMGHQFTASHTFNAATGSCSGNGVTSSAYEPGSGTTIMAYAGICGNANDLQPNSDAYFHARSLLQITNNLETGTASTCGTSMATGNDIPAVAPIVSTDTFFIPLLTHFELTVPAVTNSLASAPLTYCWEQYDLGQFGTSVNTFSRLAPIFRSFSPDTATTRVFPRISQTVRNIKSSFGERLPDTARFMRFTLTVRDVYNGFGAFSWGEDTVRMRVINTGDTFRVTSQGGATPAAYLGASTQMVEWDVAGTTAAPVNAATVNILYSLDSGYTYPYTLASGAPNNGTAQVIIPNVATTAGRIKVKAASNVFFDLNDRPFAVTFDPIAAGVAQTPWAGDVAVYPVPASEQVFVKMPAGKTFSASVTNALGQAVWRGTLTGAANIAVGRWAKGVYTLQLMDTKTGGKAVKRIVVE